MFEQILNLTHNTAFLVDANYLDFPSQMIAFEMDTEGNLYLIEKDWVEKKRVVSILEAISIIENLPEDIFYL
jgi:hypothetical protein